MPKANIIQLQAGAVLIRVNPFRDRRGEFTELWNPDIEESFGLPRFIGDNLSNNARGVVRGLHAQIPYQAKLVRAASGQIIDFFVDIRKDSETYGLFQCVDLIDPLTWVYVPPGFAHGFCCYWGEAVVHYKVDVPYAPDGQLTLNWRPYAQQMGVDFEFQKKWITSQKDDDGHSWESLQRTIAKR